MVTRHLMNFVNLLVHRRQNRRTKDKWGVLVQNQTRRGRPPDHPKEVLRDSEPPPTSSSMLNRSWELSLTPSNSAGPSHQAGEV
jgi:hypothetical protein